MNGNNDNNEAGAAAAEESVNEAVETAQEGASAAKRKGPRLPLPSSLQAIVGALLFASKNPLSANDLKNCIRSLEPDEDDDSELMDVFRTCTAREIDQALQGLAKELDRAQVGFRLVCAAGTYRLQTDPACGRYVRALLKLDRPTRLGRASLETLAIVAYRQPVSKGEVEQIRGVAVDSIMKSLLDLGLVRIVGRSELPGHPFLYGTTQLFLEHFGLASLQQLNELDPTLQRSNPKERAALFKKPPKEDAQIELPADGENAAAEPAAEPPAGKPAQESPAGEGDQDALEGEDNAPGLDDDDVFIDDTPDEFDDDDDDDDEDDNGDDEEEYDEEDMEDGDDDNA